MVQQCLIQLLLVCGRLLHTTRLCFLRDELLDLVGQVEFLLVVAKEGRRSRLVHCLLLRRLVHSRSLAHNRRWVWRPVHPAPQLAHLAEVLPVVGLRSEPLF